MLNQLGFTWLNSINEIVLPDKKFTASVLKIKGSSFNFSSAFVFDINTSKIDSMGGRLI